MQKNHSLTCPNCGKPKKPWFGLCFDCNAKEKQKPTCEVCGTEVPEGHHLCKEHWKEKQEGKKKLKQIDYVKSKKEIDFREKFEGKYYFNGQKVKSKSELLLLYFFEANDLKCQYETPIYPNGKEYRPDFIICDGDNQIIIEHFGMDDESYKKKREAKIKEYEKLCDENKDWFFIWTDENDMHNLKDKLGKKLNFTPLNKLMWK